MDGGGASELAAGGSEPAPCSPASSMVARVMWDADATGDTKAEYGETMRKALVAGAEEYFVRTLEHGGKGVGHIVMKRQAYILKNELFDYEAEILPMIKTRVQRAISDEA